MLKLLLWMYFTLYQSILFLPFFLNELLLVPWIERIDFISNKWSLFGGTLRRIHVSFIPSEFKYGLRRETLYLILIFVASVFIKEKRLLSDIAWTIYEPNRFIEMSSFFLSTLI